MRASPTTTDSGLNRRRFWGFRLTAVALGLSVFAMTEGLCVLFDWGRPAVQDDPFVGFSAIHPLFTLDRSTGRYEIARSRRQFFAAESFPAHKSPGTLRIFCLGGSTVQGRPFSIQTSFTTWLQLNLTAADSDRNWEVVNCGGISYASYRLVPILKECLHYDPDLFVICTGHNEFLEDRTYGSIKQASPAYRTLQETMGRLRTYQLLRAALWSSVGRSRRSKPQDVPILKDEVDALLDYRNGLEIYHRDDHWRSNVIDHFAYNLRRMIAVARSNGIPVILIRPPSNLRDFPPFKSQHRRGMTTDELREWRSLITRARSHFDDDLDLATQLFERAAVLDNRYAAVWYELGRCYEARGRNTDARQAYLKARDEDICPLRIVTPMEQLIGTIAEQTGTPLVDAAALLERQTTTGILGGLLLADHVHPSIRGHQLIADALAATMVQQGWVRPTAGWQQRRTTVYRTHFQSLDSIYFARGRRELNNLEAWAHGRADGPLLDPAPTVSGR